MRELGKIQRFGAGRRVLVCFHGFGQRPALFRTLAEVAQATVYGVPLPLSGNSALRLAHEPHFLPTYYRAFAAFLAQERVERFELVGFSIGARLAACLAVEFAPRVQRLTLLAPDGFARRWVFTFATGTHVGRMTFRWALRYGTPLWYGVWVSLRVLRVLSAADSALVRPFVYAPAQRELLLDTWLTCRYFRPSIADMAKKCAPEMPCNVVLAAQDPLIRPAHLQRLLQAWPQAQVVTLPTTHAKLVHQWIQQAREL